MVSTLLSKYVGLVAWSINGFALDLHFDTDIETTSPERQLQLHITAIDEEQTQIKVAGRTRDVPLDLGVYRRNPQGQWEVQPESACLMEERATGLIAARIDNWLE